MGRPSSFTEELADIICAELASGKSLRKICEPDEMPNRETVRRWQVENEAFAAKCARARDAQADEYFDRVADVVEGATPESAPADRVKLAGLQWMASKLAPRRYGDKLQLAGDEDSPLKVEIVRFGDNQAAL